MTLHQPITGADGNPLVDMNGRPIERRRSGERVVSTLMVGRVIADAGDTLCRIRNISSGGARIETALPLQPLLPLQLELRGHAPIAATVRWIGGGGAGVAFDGPVPCETLLHPQPAKRGWQPRAPRIDVATFALLRQGQRFAAVQIVDLHQRGARLLIDGELLRTREFQLEIDRLPARSAVLCWQKDGQMGVFFPEPLPFRTLGQWLLDSEWRWAARD